MPDQVPDVTSPPKIRMFCDNMQKVEDVRATSRASINTLFNGQQPWNAEQVKKYHIKKNVNWQEGTNKLLDANRQVNSAFIPAGNFFTVTSRGGKVEKRDEHGQRFSLNANWTLKRGKTGKRHVFLLKNRNASVALHGPGVLMWMRSDRLLPKFVGLEDFLVPTDTSQDFCDLMYCAVNVYPTIGEFFDWTHGKHVDKGWRKGVVNRILADTKIMNVPGFTSSDWINRPEAAAEVFKQNRMAFDSDSTVRIRLRLFFYYDTDKEKWFRKIILRDSTMNQSVDEFVYDSTEPWADELDHFLHVQYGDGSVVAPLKFHSVRGLGVMLYGPTWTINELRSSFIDHVQQNLQPLLRRSEPADRDASKVVELYPYSFVPDGVSFVKRDERHQIDARLAESGLSQMRQLMAENSSGFTSDIDTGTPKEMTAFEARARLNAASRQVASMLGMMYVLEVYYYEELVRRLCMENPTDPDIVKFQKKCKADGIPDDLMKPENWIITPERVLGAGDQTLAQAIAQTLFSVMNQFDPPAQKLIKRLFVSNLTENPDMAQIMVPDAEPEATDGVRAAENVFGTMMESGIPVVPRKGIDHEGYVSSALSMLENRIQLIETTDGMGEPADLAGMSAVAKSIEEHIGIMAMDENKKQIVREFSDILGELNNMLVAFQQRQQEATDAAQPDPETQAKIAGMQALTEQKVAASEITTQQKVQQRDVGFRQKLQQQQAKMIQQQMEAKLKMQIEAMQASADTRIKQLEAQVNMMLKTVQAASDTENNRLKALATAKNSD